MIEHIVFNVQANKTLSNTNESFYGCWTKGHTYECIAFGDFVSVRNDSGMYTQFTKEAFEKFKDKIA